VQYSNGFKARMVQRMAGAERISASALAKEVGVTQPTLSRWLRDARTVAHVGGSSSSGKGRGSKRSQKRTAEEKLRLVQEAASLSGEELGAFLRREGVHEAQLDEWRSAVLSALSPPKKKSAGPSSEARQVAALEKELDRKEKALAELAALLALKKKAQEIWGDGDDDTNT
jgi:transposase